MEWVNELNPGIVTMLIPIVAIIMGGIYAITKAVIRHRERLAMIERGMHPDFPAPAEGQRTPSER